MTRFDPFDPVLLALLGDGWWVLVCGRWVVVGGLGWLLDKDGH